MNHAEYLCHSSGPWKKHKYFQKIGEGANAVYRYAKKGAKTAKEAVESVPGRITGEYYDKEADKYNDEYWKHVEDSVEEAKKQGPAVRGIFDNLAKSNISTDPSKRRYYREVSDRYAQDYDRAYNKQKEAEAKADAAREKRDENWKKSYNAPAKKVKRTIDKTKERVEKAKKKFKHDGMYSSEYLNHADEVARGQAKIDALFGR